jgi:hypothetical protein
MRRIRSVETVGAALAATLGMLWACGGTTAPVTGGDAGGSSGSSSGATGSSSGVSGSSSGISGSSSGVTGSSSGTAACGSHPCQSPAPLVVGGVDTGYDTCAGGALRRRAVVGCPSLLPRAGGGVCPPGGGVGCSSDKDCTDKPLGICQSGDPGGCFCIYGCARDSDCGSGEVCVCGDPVGRCEPASCGTGGAQGAGCGGCDCIDSTDYPGCPGKSFACQSPYDQCTSDLDCPSGEMCSHDAAGHHVCSKTTCAVGRPFLVQGDERLAIAVLREDWAARGIAPNLRGLAPATRARLAGRWTEIARMEHASIAAFARFTMHLLAVGAPPELVRASQDAMGDETEHARLAFALAGAYARTLIGPGPLAIAGSLDGFGIEQLVATLVREGCIGETVAAIEAREALETATDPAVRAVLETIARDEQRHAELAWRTIAWLVAQGRVTHARVVAEIEQAARETRPAATDDADLSAHGLVSDARRAELRRAALDDVILPCARGFAQALSNRATSSRGNRRNAA